jgi:hypothetical protein
MPSSNGSGLATGGSRWPRPGSKVFASAFNLSLEQILVSVQASRLRAFHAARLAHRVPTQPLCCKLDGKLPESWS